jgi:hypothetical protein
MIIICPPEKAVWWESMLTSAPSLVMSALAFGLSIRSFFYTRAKDAKARRQSIQDDFWLRKVVSPNSIEPFVKYTTELRATLPTVGVLTHIEGAQSLWSTLSTKLSELVAGFQLLDLVDETLTPKVQDHLDVIDEELATYCGNFIAMLSGEPGSTTPDRSASLLKIAEAQKAIFELIHAHQSALGNDPQGPSFGERIKRWWTTPTPPPTP